MLVKWYRILNKDMDGFHVKYFFIVFVRRPNFLEAQNRSRQLENLENL